jgi:hypothetical protein
MGIASLSTMLGCDINGLDHVLFSATTSVRTLTIIEPVCKDTIDWARHGRAIDLLFEIGRTDNATMVILDSDCTGLWSLALATRCRAHTCIHPIRHDAINRAILNLALFLLIW